jgi:hypothetical protein
MTTLLYYILKSRFWQQIVMTSPPNLGGEGEPGKEGYASRVNLSLSTKNPPKQSYPLSWTKGDRQKFRKRVSSRNPFSRYCFLAESLNINWWI